MDLGLRGKRAIVTGGTRGIGRAIVATLAAEGCDVALCARNAQQVNDVVEGITEAGVRAFGSAVDVSDPAAQRDFIAKATSDLGGLDIFVANVSALGVANDEATWRKSLEVDVMGTVTGCETALGAMLAGAGGSIVIIGTVSLNEAAGGVQPYRSVKAALVPYMKAVAHAHGGKGVRCNMVSPGTIYFEGGVWNMIETHQPERYRQAMARNPMGRMGTPQEIADVVTFVASPRASFMTGANVVVDGAITVRVQY